MGRYLQPHEGAGEGGDEVGDGHEETWEGNTAGWNEGGGGKFRKNWGVYTEIEE
jgi:hypothetical protein